MITWKLFVWVIVIAINVWFASKRQKPNYLVQGGLRGMASILHGALFISSQDQWPLYLVLVIFQTTSFWIIFEIWLNIIWGEKLMYYDTKELDSGWIDRFFAWAGPGFHFAAKVGALIIMVLSIIVIYHQA